MASPPWRSIRTTPDLKSRKATSLGGDEDALVFARPLRAILRLLVKPRGAVLWIPSKYFIFRINILMVMRTGLSCIGCSKVVSYYLVSKYFGYEMKCQGEIARLKALSFTGFGRSGTDSYSKRPKIEILKMSFVVGLFNHSTWLLT